MLKAFSEFSGLSSGLSIQHLLYYQVLCEDTGTQRCQGDLQSSPEEGDTRPFGRSLI